MRLFYLNNALLPDSSHIPCSTRIIKENYKLFISLRKLSFVMGDTSLIDLFNEAVKYNARYWRIDQLDAIFSLDSATLPEGLFNTFSNLTVKSYWTKYKNGDLSALSYLQVATGSEEQYHDYIFPTSHLFGEEVGSTVTENTYADYFFYVNQQYEFNAGNSVDNYQTLRDNQLTGLSLVTGKKKAIVRFDIDGMYNLSDDVGYVTNYYSGFLSSKVNTAVISSYLKATIRDFCTDFTGNGGVGILYDLYYKENFEYSVSQQVPMGCTAGKKIAYLRDDDAVTLTSSDLYDFMGKQGIDNTPVNKSSQYYRSCMLMTTDGFTSTLYDEPIYTYYTTVKPKRLNGFIDVKASITQAHKYTVQEVFGYNPGVGSTAHKFVGDMSRGIADHHTANCRFTFNKDVRFTISKRGDLIQLIRATSHNGTTDNTNTTQADTIALMDIEGGIVETEVHVYTDASYDNSYYAMGIGNSLGYAGGGDYATNINAPNGYSLTVTNGVLNASRYEGSTTNGVFSWDSAITKSLQLTYLPIGTSKTDPNFYDDGLNPADYSYQLSYSFAELYGRTFADLSNEYKYVHDGVSILKNTSDRCIKTDTERVSSATGIIYFTQTGAHQFTQGGSATHPTPEYVTKMNYLPALNSNNYATHPSGELMTDYLTLDDELTGVTEDTLTATDEKLREILKETDGTDDVFQLYKLMRYIFAFYQVIDENDNCITMDAFFKSVSLDLDKIERYRLNHGNVNEAKYDLGMRKVMAKQIWYALENQLYMLGYVVSYNWRRKDAYGKEVLYYSGDHSEYVVDMDSGDILNLPNSRT